MILPSVGRLLGPRSSRIRFTPESGLVIFFLFSGAGCISWPLADEHCTRLEGICLYLTYRRAIPVRRIPQGETHLPPTNIRHLPQLERAQSYYSSLTRNHQRKLTGPPKA